MNEPVFEIKTYCPITKKTETVYFNRFGPGAYQFNGCEEHSGAEACKECHLRHWEEMTSKYPDLTIL